MWPFSHSSAVREARRIQSVGGRVHIVKRWYGWILEDEMPPLHQTISRDEVERQLDEAFQGTALASPRPQAAIPDRQRANSHEFHRLWSACVDKPGYRKADWRAVELQLLTAGVIE